jgi:two-component system, OmpR family, alkaline phosphatase synthesis response regulator PhoP
MIVSEGPTAPEPAQASATRGKKILVIDDDPEIVRIIRYMLRDAGCQVSYAYNALDGIQKAKTEKPDVVLTDLAMPNVSGIGVIDEIRSHPETQRIPIIIVTAHACESISQVARQRGSIGCVSKPFTAQQLLKQIQQALDPEPQKPPAARPLTAPATGELRLRTD